MESTKDKMTVEVWSDIMCPFCYLGKRKFENALNQFESKGRVEVIWKSFQLQPSLVTDTAINIHEYLSQVKGIDIARAKQMNESVGLMAKQVGLNYNYDRMVVANTLKAHILLHFARKQAMQNQTKEALFRAYFTEGRNIDDILTLIEIGKESGLNTERLATSFTNENFIDEVREDIYEAQQLGIRGVPFFLFNRKYSISGAQETSVFLEVLQKSYSEWQINAPTQIKQIVEGKTCSTDGTCE